MLFYHHNIGSLEWSAVNVKQVVPHIYLLLWTRAAVRLQNICLLFRYCIIMEKHLMNTRRILTRLLILLEMDGLFRYVPHTHIHISIVVSYNFGNKHTELPKCESTFWYLFFDHHSINHLISCLMWYTRSHHTYTTVNTRVNSINSTLFNPKCFTFITTQSIASNVTVIKWKLI